MAAFLVTLVVLMTGCGAYGAYEIIDDAEMPGYTETVIPDGTEAMSAQPESTPGQSESVPGQSKSTPEQSKSTPEQSESVPGQSESTQEQSESAPGIDEEGSYSSKEDVALYIDTYGKLPGNFITKSDARALGWEGGSLEPYAPGMCIGGDKFGNYEGLLPAADGRTYWECDIDTLGKDSRGAKRIVFSSDGLIYYTDDHYTSFTLLYD